jgi:8-oxo-dGTP pyrophosphatase MutT (NUDIX family)
MSSPLRATAIVLHNDSILVMERHRKGNHYYSLIGGGVENNETSEEAAVREVFEETSITVRPVKLLYKMIYDKDFLNRSGQEIFLCDYVTGEPQLNDSVEKRKMNEEDMYHPQWLDISKLSSTLVYPLEIRDTFLEDMKSNFENCPKEIFIEVDNIRHNL